MFMFDTAMKRLKKEFDPSYTGRMNIGSEEMRLGYVTGAWDVIHTLQAIQEGDMDDVLGDKDS